MRFSLLPTMLTDRITDLSPGFLQKQNISLLMLDFDNTLVPYTTDIPEEAVVSWLECMKHSNIHICVVSNSRNMRVMSFCKKYEIACIMRARKPFARGILQCCRQFGCDPSSCALAGDQIYTDVLGANCAGVRSILVRAINNHTIWLRLRHLAEMPVIYAAKNRRIRL